MKLVLVAQPRSCSTWFMKQLERSPHLRVFTEDHHRELIAPGFRWKTRDLLGLNPIDDAESAWNLDQSYADLYWARYPNGAFKVLGQAHGHSYKSYLLNRGDIHFATIQRTDTASAIASHIACLVEHRVRGDKRSFRKQAKQHSVDYQDILSFGFETVDFRRGRLLEMFHYLFQIKSQQWIDTFKHHPRNIGNIRDTNGMEEIAARLDFEMDWSTFREPSHYTEIFPNDWQVFEKDCADILGLKVGTTSPK